MIFHGIMLQIFYTTVFRDKRLNHFTLHILLFFSSENRGINITYHACLLIIDIIVWLYQKENVRIIDNNNTLVIFDRNSNIISFSLSMKCMLYFTPTDLEMKIWIYWSRSNSWIYFYVVLNKNWKIYWSEQSFTGLWPKDWCSSWGLLQ